MLNNLNKAVIFLGDGMADEPIDELNGQTPLQYAKTPAMDSIARDGASGTLLTLPDGFPTSSDVANMSVLGCDLALEYCGRGPLEAAGQDIPMKPDDLAFRLNLTTSENGILTDFSGGHPSQEVSTTLIQELEKHFGNDRIHFYPGVSYRNILILSGDEYSANVKAEKPDDNHGNRIADHLPKANTPEAEKTAAFFRHIMTETPAIFERNEINKLLSKAGKPLTNSVWPWSGGKAGTIKTLSGKYGISSAVITAVDVIAGLGLGLGMDVISVPGATGYIDTNYEGKADAAIEALKTHDFVYLHVEAIDEVSHAQDLKTKIETIEIFDTKIVKRVLDAIGSDITAVVLPDHPVPVSTGKHTRTPVPVSIRKQGLPQDKVTSYNEISCPQGSLGRMKNRDLMDLLFS